MITTKSVPVSRRICSAHGCRIALGSDVFDRGRDHRRVGRRGRHGQHLVLGLPALVVARIEVRQHERGDHHHATTSSCSARIWRATLLGSPRRCHGRHCHTRRELNERKAAAGRGHRRMATSPPGISNRSTKTRCQRWPRQPTYAQPETIRPRSGTEPTISTSRSSWPWRLGIAVGLHLPGLRQAAEAARHRLRQPDPDDDRAGDLLHDRARHRLGPQGLPGRQGRRDRAALLHGDVDAGPHHRPDRRQRHPSGRRAAHHPGGRPEGRRRDRRRGEAVHGGLPAEHHPDHLVLGADHRGGAADAAGGAAGRLRAAGDGQERGADPEGRRPSAEARLPDPVHDHVGGADRCLRCDGGRRRGHRCGRAGQPRRADARFLPGLCALRVRHPRHGAQARHRRQHLQAVQVSGPGVPADRVDVVVGVGAAAADREDGAPRCLPFHRRRRGADRLLLQSRRHGDLSDDGLAVHRYGGRRAVDAQRADLPAACS